MLVGIVVVMFSLVSRPQPLPLETSPEPFDETAAALETNRLLAAAPERQPGSDGDAAAAAYIKEQFESLEGGTVVSDSFEARYARRRVNLENVIFTLTGETDELVVVTAPRDCAAGPCAASSASASAALIELARVMSRTHHRKTFVFVSTDGSVAGAAGAKQLAEYLDGRTVTGVIVLSQPGANRPRERHVVPWSTSTRATSIQLVRSASEAIESEFAFDKPKLRGTGSELVRLAVPAGLGEQAPMIAAGLDAVALAGAGEQRLSAEDDTEFSAETLGMIGRATVTLVQALDQAPAELVAGPRSRVPLSGKLVPGWALTLLALTLLLPLIAAAVESTALARRRHQPVVAAIAWAAGHSLPFVAAFAFAYLLSFLRLIPAPAFPFDPATWPIDFKAVIAAVLLLAGIVASQIALEDRLRPPRSPEATGSALAVMIAICGVVTWLVNPYFALTTLPALHFILIATSPRLPLPARGGLLILALLVPVIVLDALGRQLGVGFADAAWQLLLMFTGGHFGPLSALPLILLAGCLAATLQALIGGWTNMRTQPLRTQAPVSRYRREPEN